MEGRSVARGRYLLLRLLHHTRDSATYSARDQHSGLELEVEIALDPQAPSGYGVRSTALPMRPSLPDLYTPPITLEHRLSRAARRRLAGMARPTGRLRDEG